MSAESIVSAVAQHAEPRAPYREAYNIVALLIVIELGKRAARGIPPSVGDPVNKELERIRDAMRNASEVEDAPEVKP